MSFEMNKNGLGYTAELSTVPKKIEAVSETLRKLREEHGDSPFIKELSDADANDLDNAFNRNNIPFGALAYYGGDKDEMLAALKDLSNAVGEARTAAVRKIVTLVEADEV